MATFPFIVNGKMAVPLLLPVVLVMSPMLLNWAFTPTDHFSVR